MNMHVKDTQKAAEAWSDLFARRSGVTGHHLLGTLEKVHAERLRQARVRLDAVAMKVWRL